MLQLADVKCYQTVGPEFFALIPRRTINGWAWLTDLRTVRTLTLEHGWRTHYEKINA